MSENKKYYVGQTASFSKTISEADVYSFAGICGDFNPIHVNYEEAKKSQFGKRVVHGSLVSSLISTVLGMYLPGPGCIYMRQETRFIRPVFFNDTIVAEVKIIDIDEKRRATCETTCRNQEGELVIEGTAFVKLPN